MTAPTPHPPLRYVLSAGRTGTVFLESLIRSHCPGVRAEHEPPPSRTLMMLGNFRNDTGWFGGIVQRVSRYHQRRAHDGTDPYVEINPFLCAVTDTLPHRARALRLVHVVRHPADWSRSMTVFKASARYRHVIGFVPFAKPYPAPRPPGWRRLDAYEKGLHRWLWCNTRIEALAPRAEAYARVRFEDLFGPDPGPRAAALATVFDTLGLPAPDAIDEAAFARKANPAPEGGAIADAGRATRICGPLAARYGYAL